MTLEIFRLVHSGDLRHTSWAFYFLKCGFGLTFMVISLHTVHWFGSHSSVSWNDLLASSLNTSSLKCWGFLFWCGLAVCKVSFVSLFEENPYCDKPEKVKVKLFEYKYHQLLHTQSFWSLAWKFSSCAVLLSSSCWLFYFTNAE